MKNLKVFFFFFLFFSSLLFAHDSKPAYLQIKALDSENYDIVWKVPMKGIGKKYVLHVQFDNSIENIKKPIEVVVAGWHIKNWRIYKKGFLSGTKVTIEGLSSTDKEVLLRYIDLDGNKFSKLISPNHPEYIFQETKNSNGVVAAYTKMGFEHILEGIDHLLFVACLVMIANTFAKLLWTITGFTLAHSVTLFMSALGWVHVPIPPIEAMIALSIVFLAVEIVKKNTNSFTYRYPAVVSSSFGLLHGFGFASALIEIGLPAKEKIAALLFFNIGVELGQILFVILLFLFMWIIRKIWKGSIYIPWQTLISYTIGIIASMWLLERVILF